MLPVSRIGGAASWICQFAPLAVVTVLTAPAGEAATSAAAAASGSALIERFKSSLSSVGPGVDPVRLRRSHVWTAGRNHAGFIWARGRTRAPARGRPEVLEVLAAD